MKIFLDTEFSDYEGHLQLLSLGAVREDGLQFYAERGDADYTQGHLDPWVQEHVLPQFTGPVLDDDELRARFRLFCPPNAQFYAYYCTYDFYLLIQLYGRYMDFPWRQLCWDLKCMSIDKGKHYPPEQQTREHHALNDALWNKQLYEYLTKGVAPNAETARIAGG